jgi:ferric iron reductase protein FhuF
MTDIEPVAEYNSTYNCDTVELNNMQNCAELHAQSCSYSSMNDVNDNNTSSNQHIQNKRRSATSFDDHHLQTAYSIIKSVKEISKRDEFTVFGEHIAHRLRNMSDAHTRLLAQHQINDVVFEAEIAKFQPSPLNCESGTTAVTSFIKQSSSLRRSTPHNSTQFPGHQQISLCEGGSEHSDMSSGEFSHLSDL